jgi:hypothetical protein
MRYHKFSFLLLFSLLLHFFGLIVIPNIGISQPQKVNTIKPKSVPLQEATNKLDFQSKLIQIVESIEETIEERNILTKQLRSATEIGNGDALKSKIQESNLREEQLKISLDEIVSQVDPKDLETQSTEGTISLENELRSLLQPLVIELKELTSKPREIEQLKTDIFETERSINLTAKALTNVNEIKKSTSNEDVTRYLDEIIQKWISRKNSLETQLQILRSKIQQKQKDRSSFSEAISSVFQMFFRSRGRNIIIAIATSVIFWLISAKLRLLIINSPWLISRRSKFPVRLLGVILYFGTITGSLVVFIVILYFFGDWVLLLITSAIVLGAIWTSKQALSRFWSQITLILNIGSVREGEIIILNGIPWKIQVLNVYSRVNNPALSGGKLRIPAKELINMRSRPFNCKEKWFPSEEGDWINLSDGTYGEIILQTPEQVRVRLLGNAERSFQTAEYLTLKPTVLTNGYRISFFFGIDYQHQPVATERITTDFEKYLNSRSGEYDNTKKAIKSIEVELAEAGSSALNFCVYADINKGFGHLQDILKRTLNRFCVDACNKFDWVIPFNQVTLHLANNTLTTDQIKGGN